MEFGRVIFNEGEYFGEVSNGMANGYGTLKYHNGDLYVGQWVNNCQTGTGAKSGHKWYSMGTFSNGKRQGKCLTVEEIEVPGWSRPKIYYIGNYNNDYKSGHGVSCDYNANAYYGNFANNLPNGKGYLTNFLTIRDGYLAEGNFVNGKLSGQYYSHARTTFEHGTFYGEVTDNLKHYFGMGAWVGKGVHPAIHLGYHNKLDGDRISYNFKGAKILEDGYQNIALEYGDYGTDVIQKNGEFSKIYKNGDLYIGNFSSDKRCSPGTYCEVNNGRVGTFSITSGGKKVIINPAGHIKMGKFSHDDLVDGVSVFDNGDCFIYKDLVVEKRKQEIHLDFPVYHGTLNNGTGGASVYAGNNIPNNFSINASVNISQKTTTETKEKPKTNTYNSQPLPPIEPPAPAHDYGDGYGEHLTFFQRLKLERENRKELKELKKLKKNGGESPQMTANGVAKPRQPVQNSTIKALNDKYEFSANRSVLEKVKESNEELEIPPTVVTIASCAFLGDETLKKITGGKQLKTIESRAFKGCKNLETVDLSRTNLVEFNAEVFADCENLKTLILPYSSYIKRVDKTAFSGANNISLIRKQVANKPIDVKTFISGNFVDETPDEKVKRKEKEEFLSDKEKCEKLDFVTQGDNGSLTLIKVNKKAEELTIPKSVTHIAKGAFDEIKDTLKVINLPPKINYLEDGQFENLTALEKVTADCGFVIPKRCFYNCKNLKNVNFKGMCDIISESAFSGCENLAGFACSTVVQIGDDAFRNCKKIISIHAPLLEKLGGGAFVGCDSLTKLTTRVNCWVSKNCFSNNVTIHEGKSGIKKEVSIRKIPTATEKDEKRKEDTLKYAERVGAIVEYKDGKGYLKGFKGRYYNPIIPVGVNVIERSAFDEIKDVVKIITLNEESVYHGACELSVGQFEGFPILYKFETTYAKEIPENCFKDCVNLEDVKFPVRGNVTKGAFENCKRLVSIDLKNYATKIASGAFKNCTSLKEVTALGVLEFEDGAFDGCKDLTKLQVNEKCEINEFAFYGWLKPIGKIKKIVIGYNEIKIKEITFKPRSKMLVKKSEPAKKTKDEKVYSINKDGYISICSKPPKKVNISISGERAIFNGSSMHFVKNKVKELTVSGAIFSEKCRADLYQSKGLFTCIESLVKLDLSGAIFEKEEISANAFYKCNKLKEIILPQKGVTVINRDAFIDCDKLKTITAPSVQIVKSKAFWGAPSLEVATFMSAKKIEKDAFLPCGKLKTLIVASGCYVEGAEKLEKRVKIIYK